MFKNVLAGFAIIVAFAFTDASAQAPAQKPAEQKEEPPSVLAVPPDFKYSGRGRRDPFVNPIPPSKNPKTDANGVPAIRPRGLKGVLMNETQITGIVWSKDPDMTRAVLAVPGGKTYFAHKGDALFDAVVKEIQRDGVVFALQSKDSDGKITTQDVVRKVRPTP